MDVVHATCVAIDGKGVLLCGPSASGKSDLALRLIDEGALLVADDMVALTRCELGRQVIAALPQTGEHLRGVIEIRGLGLMRMPSQDRVPISLSVDLTGKRERLPGSAKQTFAGIDVDTVFLDPFESSTPAKIRAALMRERVI